MRILTLSSCALDPRLGSGKTRLRWSEGLRARGHEVDVFEPRDFEWRYGARRAIRFRQALGAIGFVEERLRELHYDIVEFFGGEFGFATKVLSRERRRPLIIAHTDGFELLASERGLAYDPNRHSISGRLRHWYERQTHDRISHAAFAFADAVVAGCQLDRDRMVELKLLASSRTAVIAPGIDREYLATNLQGPKELRVAFTGTWLPRKGVNYVVSVMSGVLRERPDLHLDLYGTSSKAEHILGEFPSSLRSRITVYDHFRENSEGLSRAKVFFFPSQYEGFGMALAEAMACGCAPVTTPTGFGAELRDGEEALVCGFGDAPAMRRAILTLLDDEGLRSRVAAAAKARVRLLSWATQIGKLESVYLSWLDARREFPLT